MAATGISKSDLLQFIQLNMLPKTLMRVKPALHDATRKKSYFSKSIVGHVTMLKLLRDEGESVETIARRFGRADDPEYDPTEQRPETNVRSIEPTEPEPETETDLKLDLETEPELELDLETEPELELDLDLDLEPAFEPANEERTADVSPPDFSIPANAITGSALFVDQEMRIGWATVAEDDALFETIRDEMNIDPSGSVFDILLRASLKELVFNWQPLFSFIYRFLEDMTPAAAFKQMAPSVSLNLDGLQHPKFFMERPQNGRPRIDSCPIRFEDAKGCMQNMRLYAITLATGALFVYDKEYWQTFFYDLVDKPFSNTPSTAKSIEEKTAFSVISARLENSQRLVHALLPETYYQLINRIWNECDRIVNSYGGQRAKRSGTEVQYIIPQHMGTDPAYDAIRCAINLREAVRTIEASLKGNDGWFSDIRLNIGISSGKDFLPLEDITASMAFMLPGGAADQAFHLSAIAQGGGILITKSAFGHLSQEQVEAITFGIYRDRRLIPKIFAQLSELPQNSDVPPMGQEIRSLFVTGIVDLVTDQEENQN
jgi:class 3 adenylate cyclase